MLSQPLLPDNFSTATRLQYCRKAPRWASHMLTQEFA